MKFLDMKVLDLITLIRPISTLDPEMELDVTLVDDLLKISHRDSPEFYVAMKVK